MKRLALGALLFTLMACGTGARDPHVPVVPSAPVAPTMEATELPIPESSPIDKKDQYYRNCAEAKEAGAAPLRLGVDDGYRAALDRDKDGIACD